MAILKGYESKIEFGPHGIEQPILWEKFTGPVKVEYDKTLSQRLKEIEVPVQITYDPELLATFADLPQEITVYQVLYRMSKRITILRKLFSFLGHLKEFHPTGVSKDGLPEATIEIKEQP